MYNATGVKYKYIIAANQMYSHVFWVKHITVPHKQ